MSEVVALLSIFAALTVGTMSPGPSFVMVVRIAAVKSRKHGLAAALGMGLGGVIFAGLALLGLQAILVAVPSLYIILKIAGGLYFC